jgi:hypothetical protein
MSFRLLRQLSRLPLRQRYFSDPFLYPTEVFYQPMELRYPTHRMKDAFEELEEMMDMLMESERIPTKKDSKKLSLEKGSETETQEKVSETKTQQKEQAQTIKSVASKKAEKESTSFFGEYNDQTFERAQKLFEQSMKEEKPALTLEENDELLKGSEEFEEIKKFFSEQGMDFSGSSYQSSTIFKDGKMVTVSKHSKLGPDGKVKTEVVQEFKDSKGQKDSRRWVKEDKIKEQIENKTQETKEEGKEQNKEQSPAADA